jgi:hypothetical protein
MDNHRLFLASPQYNGQCCTIFARSAVDLATLCAYYRLPLETYWIGCSAVHRGRNYCADEFLRSQSDHLLFIDADIGFNAHDAIELLIWQIEKPEYRIIGAPYRLKTLDKVAWAFNYGKDFDPDATEPQEVRGTGTGFLLIHRTVFEELAEHYPQWKCIADGVSGTPSTGSREMMQFFQYGVDPETRLDLTEDYWFCERCREIGIKTFTDGGKWRGARRGSGTLKASCHSQTTATKRADATGAHPFLRLPSGWASGQPGSGLTFGAVFLPADELARIALGSPQGGAWVATPPTKARHPAVGAGAARPGAMRENNTEQCRSNGYNNRDMRQPGGLGEILKNTPVRPSGTT